MEEKSIVRKLKLPIFTCAKKLITEMKMKLINILLLLCCTNVVFAQKPLSLSKAITTALEQNYDIVVVKNKQEQAEINNNWGTAGRWPSLSMNLESQNSKNYNDNDDFNSRVLSGGVTMNWTLFDGFSVNISKARLAELENLSKGNTTVLIENTIQSVILAYNQVLLEKEKLSITKEVMELSNDRYERTKVAKELGSLVTFDVLQAQNAFLSDKANYLLQQTAYKNALRDLKFVMGEQPGSAYEITDSFLPTDDTYELTDLKAKMTSNNQSLKNQYMNLSLLQKDVALMKSEYLPRLSLSAGGSLRDSKTDYQTQPTINSDSRLLFGNLTLSYSLFNGGKRKRAVQLAKLEEEVGKVNIDKLTHSLDNQLSNLYEFYVTRKELLNVATENLTAAKLNLQIAEEKFKNGAINSFNFRDVQLIYMNAAQQKLQAIYNLVDSQTALLRITGGIIQEYQQN
ncbi:TolC family protein [Puteibacter caeruleilacunae]|nr:TolC family protein [Puteibacter caeruleilacunae]